MTDSANQPPNEPGERRATDAAGRVLALVRALLEELSPGRAATLRLDLDARLD
jgi:hypothetical protein